MDITIGILGNDFNITTRLVENLIYHTKADTDQDHIKMNVVINNFLLKKSEQELIDIINKLKESKIDYLILTVNDNNLYQLIVNNNINIVNESFDINDNSLVKKIINLCGKEYKE